MSDIDLGYTQSIVCDIVSSDNDNEESNSVDHYKKYYFRIILGILSSSIISIILRIYYTHTINYEINNDQYKKTKPLYALDSQISSIADHKTKPILLDIKNSITDAQGKKIKEPKQKPTPITTQQEQKMFLSRHVCTTYDTDTISPKSLNNNNYIHSCKHEPIPFNKSNKPPILGIFSIGPNAIQEDFSSKIAVSKNQKQMTIKQRIIVDKPNYTKTLSQPRFSNKTIFNKIKISNNICSNNLYNTGKNIAATYLNIFMYTIYKASFRYTCLEIKHIGIKYFVNKYQNSETQRLNPNDPLAIQDAERSRYPNKKFQLLDAAQEESAQYLPHNISNIYHTISINYAIFRNHKYANLNNEIHISRSLTRTQDLSYINEETEATTQTNISYVDEATTQTNISYVDEATTQTNISIQEEENETYQASPLKSNPYEQYIPSSFDEIDPLLFSNMPNIDLSNIDPNMPNIDVSNMDTNYDALSNIALPDPNSDMLNMNPLTYIDLSNIDPNIPNIDLSNMDTNYDALSNIALPDPNSDMLNHINLQRL